MVGGTVVPQVVSGAQVGAATMEVSFTQSKLAGQSALVLQIKVFT
jgi:hypothetical protein